MKSLSTCIVTVAVLFAVPIQGSCDRGRRDRDAQVASLNSSNQQQSSDDQLLREIEQFASNEQHEGNSAWQSLQSRDRSKLIADLTRIVNVAGANDRNRLLIAFTFCKLQHDYASNRQVVVSALARNERYKDWAVSLVRRLMLDGDKDLLVPLFEASEWSDGAMSMDLAHAYSQALVTDAENFLRLLSLRPEPTRSKVLTLLKHNSLNAEDRRKVESDLKNVIRQTNLRRIAEQTVRAITN